MPASLGTELARIMAYKGKQIGMKLYVRNHELPWSILDQVIPQVSI